MARSGINTVRTYTPPHAHLLDEAARHGLRVMVGLPWSQHVAFLDDRALDARDPARGRRERAEARRIPPRCCSRSATRFRRASCAGTGSMRVERFLRGPVRRRQGRVAATACSPTSTFRRPSSSISSFFDVCAFNVYLHREADLRAYLARLQHIAGQKPLLLAEAGADSIREGEDGQAAITAMHIRAAFEEGACGAVAFCVDRRMVARRHRVDDWAFGLVDRERQPEAGAAAVARRSPTRRSRASAHATWPRVSVVVCAYNAADTLEDCLHSLERLTYPDYEVILVNDGSTRRTGEIAPAHTARARHRHARTAA